MLGFPFLDLTHSILMANNDTLSSEQLRVAGGIVLKLINNQITIDEIRKKDLHIRSLIEACTRIQEIMATDKMPIPPSPEKEILHYGERKKTRQWTKYEDNRLLMAVYKFGLSNWNVISEFVGSGRTKTQCCQRWARGLDPRISKADWTEDEERRLLALVKDFGIHAWTKISAALGNRTDFQCRYRYFQLKKSEEEKQSQKDKRAFPIPQILGIQVQPQTPTVFLDKFDVNMVLDNDDTFSFQYAQEPSFIDIDRFYD